MNEPVAPVSSPVVVPPAARATPTSIWAARWRCRVWQPLPLALLCGVLAFVLGSLALPQAWATTIQIGGGFDSPFLRGFHRAEFSELHQTDFRWTEPRAEVLLPGVNQSVVGLRIHGDTPNFPLTLTTGDTTYQLVLRSGWQTIMIAPAPDWRGDVRIGLAAPAQTSPDDPRLRGVALSHISVSSRNAAVSLVQPLLIGLSSALAVLLVSATLRGTRARLPLALLTGGSLAVGSAWLLASDQRMWLTSYSARWLLVLLLGIGIWAGVQALLNWLAQQQRIPTDPRIRNSLAAAAVLAGVLRYAALAYPLNHNSDLRYILGRTWMIRDGQFLTLFLPNPALTPVQWEMDVTIPRSPFFYLLNVPMTFLPGRGSDALGMLAFSSVVDALAVVLVGLLVLHVGGGQHAAWAAAMLAATLPFGLQMIVSWGILPTLLAQMLALLTVYLWLELRPQLPTGPARLIIAGVLALAFLAYPTALVFLGATGVLLVLMLAMRRDPATVPTAQAGMLATAIALLLYYGWHMPALLNKTLPTLFGPASAASTAPAAGNLSTLSLPRTLVAITAQPLDKYGILLLLLALSGSAMLLLRLRGPRVYAGLVLAAWSLAYLPFALLDEYIVTLILKQVLWLLPMLAILAGLTLGRMQHSRAGRWLTAAVLLWIGWQGMVLLSELVRFAFMQLK